MWQICVLSRQKICHNKLSFFLYKVHQQFWGGATLHTAQDHTQKYVKLLVLIIFYKMNTDNDALLKFWFHLAIY